MQVHEDFTSHKLTLVFDTGKQVELTLLESKELEKWYLDKEKERKTTGKWVTAMAGG